MAELIIQNIDPKVLQHLEALAKLHGRSLQEEIQHILETAAETQAQPHNQTQESVQAKATRMQQQLKHHARIDLDHLENFPDPSLNFSIAFEKLNLLKQTISSLDNLTIRQAIEEGRRF